MKTKDIHQCQCDSCQQAIDAPTRQIHQQINLVMGCLDEQQQRWYAAVEANRHGHGGIKLVSQMTGLDEKTIQRGQEELALNLTTRPEGRVRLPGARRSNAPKKTLL